jgi:hypothetical protein
MNLEQQRRDLMSQDRRLYDYVAAREIAKVLDRLGDRLSGVSHEAANLVGREAAEWNARWSSRAREEIG